MKFALLDTEKLAKQIPVTPEDVQRYYNAHQDQYRVPDQVTVRHILIKTPDATDGKVDQKAVDAARASVVVGQSAPLRVLLDVPAPPAGRIIVLSAAGVALSVPPSIFVEPLGLFGTFTVQAGTDVGTATVTATVIVGRTEGNDAERG